MEPIKIFKETDAPETKFERFIKIEDKISYILIHLVDKFGQRISSGSLLKISKIDGRIHLYTGVNSNMGLALDKDNRLITY